MTKITLEDVAHDLEYAVRDWKNLSVEFAGPKLRKQAALCRSAQRVIEAAGSLMEGSCDGGIPIKNMTDVIAGELFRSLAAHARNEQGTGEQP